MSQLNGHKIMASDEAAEQTEETILPRTFRAWPLDGNILRDVPFLGAYAWFWNQYINGLSEMQQFVMRTNQSLLQAWGIPTTEDVARINRQLFEAFVRLDTLESRLDEIENKK